MSESHPLPFKGMLRISHDRITEIDSSLTPLRDEPVYDLGDHILMPGMINAHCHLDYTHLKGAIFPGKSFVEWIKNINALKQNFGPEDYLKSIEDGFSLLLKSGCTTVFNIEAFPELIYQINKPPLRTWWFLELIDVRSRLNRDETLMGALRFFNEYPDQRGGFGLSPHAPYTASVELFRLAKHCSEKFNMPYTTHIAESLEEQEMFLHGAGDFYDFLKSLGRNMEDCGQGSALSHLLDFGVLNKKCLAVHLNYLQEYDWPSLASHPLSVVHCPKCHTYFNHRRFPLEQLRSIGNNICIGTDSLASNDTLDLRAEIREAMRSYPHISPKEWLQMVTVNPAKAIDKEKEIGVIQPGAKADLVSFHYHNKEKEGSTPEKAVIYSKEKPSHCWIDGEKIEL